MQSDSRSPVRDAPTGPRFNPPTGPRDRGRGRSRSPHGYSGGRSRSRSASRKRSRTPDDGGDSRYAKRRRYEEDQYHHHQDTDRDKGVMWVEPPSQPQAREPDQRFLPPSAKPPAAPKKMRDLGLTTEDIEMLDAHANSGSGTPLSAVDPRTGKPGPAATRVKAEVNGGNTPKVPAAPVAVPAPPPPVFTSPVKKFEGATPDLDTEVGPCDALSGTSSLLTFL